MHTPSVKKMARSTTEGIYASTTTTLLQDSFSSTHSQHNKHSNPSSPHQPACQDTGLTQNLPGSQLRRLGMDGLSALCSRSDNTSTSVIDEFFGASASAGWLSGSIPTLSDPTTVPLPGCLDGCEDARTQDFYERAADFISRKRAKSLLRKTAAQVHRPHKSRSSRRSTSSVEPQHPHQSQADCVLQTPVTHNSPQQTTQSDISQPPIKIENEDEIQAADTPHYSPAQDYCPAETSSLSPTLHPSIEHDDYEFENDYRSRPQTPDNYFSDSPTPSPSHSPRTRSSSPYLSHSVEYENQGYYERNFSRQSPGNYHPTVAKPTSPTFQCPRISQSPSPAPSTQSDKHLEYRRGSNKRSSDVFLSLPPELNQRAAKRQRVGDVSEAIEPQSLNSCSQSSPFPTIRYASKRSHAAAFQSAGEIESVPFQASKKRRTQEFKTAPSSRSSLSLRNLPGRQLSRFSLRDFLRKRNRLRAATLPRFQFDGADDQPSANTHGSEEREMSPDSLFDDDECSPGQNGYPGGREASPDSLFNEDELECTGQDKETPDTGVTLPDSSSAERECPPEQGGQESNPPSIPPQTETAPVVENKGTESVEDAACERAESFPAAFRAFLNHQTTGQYASPYKTCEPARASVVRNDDPPPANLYSPSVEAATPGKEGQIDEYRRRIVVLTRERDAACKKVQYWSFVEPATGKTREQMLKAEPMQLKRTLKAQERKTQNALSELGQLKQQYAMLASVHNDLIAKHSAAMGLPPPVPAPSNQVWLGPSANGSGPVGGPAPSSSQRRSTMPRPRNGAAAGRAAPVPVPAPAPAPARAPVPANPQPGRVNFVDLTGEDPVPAACAPAPAAVARPPMLYPAVPRPAPSWAPSPAVAAPSSTANAAPVNRAPVPAPVPAPRVPAAAATPANVARQPAARPPTTRREPMRRTPANANYNRPNAAASKQAPVPATSSNQASIPPINNPVVAEPESPAPVVVPDKSTSPEAEELRSRFRTKDYSWLQGNNHMANRRKPVFGPKCAPPVPAPPIDVPASRFRREREKEEAAAARAIATARRKMRVEKAKARAAARAASSTSPVAEDEGSVGISMSQEEEDVEEEDDLCADLARELEEELAKQAEEDERRREEEGAGLEAGGGDGDGEPGFTDEQLLRMMEGDFDEEM